MMFWKKFVLVCCFIGAMYLGGMSTQSSSTLAQGFGFIVIIMAFVLLYVIAKVMWRAMGFMSSFFVIGSVVIFILYCLGLLGGKNSMETFISGDKKSVQQTEEPLSDLEYEMFQQKNENTEKMSDALIELDETIAEKKDDAQAFSKEKKTVSASVEQRADQKAEVQETQPISELQPMKEERNVPPARQLPVAEAQGEQNDIVGQVKSFFFGGGETQKNAQNQSLNPLDYPYVEGTVKVVSGSLVKMGSLYIKLLGVEAPYPNQKCANRHGAPYACGLHSIAALQNFINKQTIRCHIVGEIVNDKTTGVCFSQNGKYDIAAVMANAGWVVAYTKHTVAYVPYEQKASENKKGLWAGKFYKPWDWLKIQNRKIVVTTESPAFGSGFSKWFDGLF